MSETEYSTRVGKKNRQSLVSNVNIQASVPRTGRMSMGGGRFGTMSMRTNVMSSGMMPPRPAGELAMISKKSVESVKDTRNKEKSDLSGLNQKLADRIEKMKFLEGQCAQLRMECDKWKAMKLFDDTKIKELISDEIEELRNNIKELNDRNNKLQAENLRLQDKVDTSVEDMAILRKQRDQNCDEKEKMCYINSELENDLAKLRRQMDMLEARKKQVEEEMNGMRDDIERLRDDLQQAREQHLCDANLANARIEELEMENDLKDQECEELKKLIRQMQSIEPNYAGMWEGQFKESLMKLQADCDERIKRHMDDVNRTYETKLATLQAQMPRDTMDSARKVETKTLKSEMGGLNSKIKDLERERASLLAQLQDLQDRYNKECAECEQEKEKLRQEINDERADKEEVKAELEDLTISNFSLKEEIAIYKSLLDTGLGETLAEQGNYQTRGGSMAYQAITGGRGGGAGAGGSGGGSSSQSSNTRFMSESSGRMTVQKQSYGGVVIENLAVDGKFCDLANKSSKDIDLSGMRLTRTFQKGTKPSEYVFEKGTILRPNQKLRIFSFLFGDEAAYGDLSSSDSEKCKTWGAGTGKMTLFDVKANKDLAVYTITYS